MAVVRRHEHARTRNVHTRTRTNAASDCFYEVAALQNYLVSYKHSELREPLWINSTSCPPMHSDDLAHTHPCGGPWPLRQRAWTDPRCSPPEEDAFPAPTT